MPTVSFAQKLEWAEITLWGTLALKKTDNGMLIKMLKRQNTASTGYNLSSNYSTSHSATQNGELLHKMVRLLHKMVSCYTKW